MAKEAVGRRSDGSKGSNYELYRPEKAPAAVPSFSSFSPKQPPQQSKANN